MLKGPLATISVSLNHSQRRHQRPRLRLSHSCGHLLINYHHM
jgi:hypothetical protein